MSVMVCSMLMYSSLIIAVLTKSQIRWHLRSICVYLLLDTGLLVMCIACWLSMWIEMCVLTFVERLCHFICDIVRYCKPDQQDHVFWHIGADQNECIFIKTRLYACYCHISSTISTCVRTLPSTMHGTVIVLFTASGISRSLQLTAFNRDFLRESNSSTALIRRDAM